MGYSTTNDPETHEDFRPTTKVVNSGLSKTDIVEQDVKENPVVIYMKGVPEAPQCGFSSLAVRVLKQYNVPLSARNILEDLELKTAVKAFRELSWYPTKRRNYHNCCPEEPRNKRHSVYARAPNLSRRDLYHSTTSRKVASNAIYSVLQSSCLQHWFKNWQELRRHKLTASTFGGAVGFWPGRRVQLWQEKIGVIEPFTGNLATCWSNIKEEEALERYKLITGNTVSFPDFQIYGKKNPEDDWLAASPDGVIDQFVYGLPSRGVLEIKCPYFNGDMRRAYPWSRIPNYCIPQAQGLMEILDRDWMDFYVWTPNGSSLFRLHRDVEYWRILKVALSDFWWKHVQPAKELRMKSRITDPLTQMSSLKPEPRHELYCSIICASKHLVDSSKLLMREIHGALLN